MCMSNTSAMLSLLVYIALQLGCDILVSPWQCMLCHVMCTCPKTPLEQYPSFSSEMRYYLLKPAEF